MRRFFESHVSGGTVGGAARRGPRGPSGGVVSAAPGGVVSTAPGGIVSTAPGDIVSAAPRGIVAGRSVFDVFLSANRRRRFGRFS